ncbi:MAG: hypothetical protein SGCHY_000366 [Lobulomycetales sp.]
MGKVVLLLCLLLALATARNPLLLRRQLNLLTDTDTCMDLNSCITSTNNCSNHGSCAPLATRPGCYSCVCSTINSDDSGNPIPGYNGPVKWTGKACAQQDISSDFHLIFWTSFMLFFALLICISLVNGIGNGDGINGPGSSVRPKSD